LPTPTRNVHARPQVVRAPASADDAASGRRAGRSAAQSTHEFVTLFDVRYLPRGLVLYESLCRTSPSFRLRVLCMDRLTKSVLDGLDLPSLETIALDELERSDPELVAVKGSRSAVEYCWTVASALCLHCFEREPGLGIVSYLDADLRFYADPAPVFEELGEGSVLLTAHRYGPRWRWLERDSGPFNVQLVTFRRDERALRALRWWRERCLDWCYDRVEPGRFGDQRYLDDWPERFEGVHVVRHPGAGLGPWCSGGFSLGLHDGQVTVDGRPLLFHHFHGLRLYRPGRTPQALEHAAGGNRTRLAGAESLWSSDFPLSRLELEALWRPYVDELARQTERVLALAPELAPVLDPGRDDALARRLAMRAPRPLPELAARAHRAFARRRSGRGTTAGQPPERAQGAAEEPSAS
jgi:hypothetical protein